MAWAGSCTDTLLMITCHSVLWALRGLALGDAETAAHLPFHIRLRPRNTMYARCWNIWQELLRWLHYPSMNCGRDWL
ncbi:hypothetical protein F5B22DRAFT_599805, partial [Xylaria bambusicola]|uniref:uncharacterized protein n=1 Tax=Xylaria bambusicola TaxID=326684 RepID=UPI0020079467